MNAHEINKIHAICQAYKKLADYANTSESNIANLLMQFEAFNGKKIKNASGEWSKKFADSDLYKNSSYWVKENQITYYIENSYKSVSIEFRTTYPIMKHGYDDTEKLAISLYIGKIEDGILKLEYDLVKINESIVKYASYDAEAIIAKKKETLVKIDEVQAMVNDLPYFAMSGDTLRY